jgi:DNA-binding transcriptional LysR family regulator
MPERQILDLQDCGRLVALVEHGSFAAAARALGMSQPALTRAVQAMEARLGAEVVHRLPTGVRPTDLGQLVLDRARDLLARAGDLEASLRQARGAETGELAIALGPYAAAMLLESALAQIVGEARSVRLHTFVGDWTDVLQRLRAGQVGLGVMETSLLADDPALEVRPLRTHEAHWVVRRGHPLDRGRDATMAEVVEHACAVPARLPPRVLEQILRARGRAAAARTPTVALQCADIGLLLRLAARVDVAVPVPLLLARPWLEAGTLVAIGREPWMVTQFGIVRPRQRPVNPIAARVAEALVQADAEFAAATEAFAASLARGAKRRAPR